MPHPENLQIDDLSEGQRVIFTPETVGVRHDDFGLLADYVAFVQRVGDTLVAELADGRRLEVRRRHEPQSPRYSLCLLGD